MILTSFTINEPFLQQWSSAHGEVGHVMAGIADRIVNQAIINASSRPGPMIRTGDLVSEIHKAQGDDEEGIWFDVGSTAVHRDYFYPMKLETGEDGQHFPWLRRALDHVFALSA